MFLFLLLELVIVLNKSALASILFYKGINSYKIPLRSTKWNASLILLRDHGELGALWKNPHSIHIPVRAQKWPPRFIFAGACHGTVINYGHGQ